MNLGNNRHTCTCNWITLLYTWDSHNSANRPHSNIRHKSRKECIYMCVTASLCSTVKINTLNQSYFNQKIKIGKKKHSLNLCQRKNDALMDELVSGQRVKGACLHLPHMTPLLLPQHRFHSLRAVCVLPIDPNLDQAALVPHASGLKPHHC